MVSEIYKILYVENNAEKVTQLRQIVRANSLDSKITFDITTTDSIEGIHLAVNKENCNLIILQDSPKVPVLKEVIEAIGIKTTPILVLVNPDQFLEKRQMMIDEGAIDVGILQQGNALFKQIARAVFEVKTQDGYRELLEKNAKLVELTEQFASSSEDLIAYFGAEDGLFLYANDAFLNYLGYQTFDELAATTVLEYVSAEQSALFKKMMKIVGKTGKEQQETLSLKHPNGEILSENVLIKQTIFEESACLELFIAKNTNNNVVVESKNVEVQPLSEQAKFYDRLLFIDSLTNFVGSSSWLVSVVLQDYFEFRKKYGIKILETYLFNLAKHLESQISNLHYARYSDESLVLLMTNSDMTKVDRLGMAITSSAEGFIYKVGNIEVSGKFTFAYTNLGDSIESISDSCNRLDELAGLLDARLVISNQQENVIPANTITVSELTPEDNNLDEEFLPLHKALSAQQIKQTYMPIVDFSMKGEENYIASFNLYDADGDAVVWNKSFTYTASNTLMRDLDIFMMQQAVASVRNANDSVKRLAVPLSMYYLNRVDELIAWIKENGHDIFAGGQVCIGLAEEVVNEHFEATKKFFSGLKQAGYLGLVHDVVDITSTQVTDLDVVLVALSESCIGRMSRGLSSDELKKFPVLLSAMSDKGASILATGVNSPTSMTLVWEYNIPYACGNMIGAPSLALDFDFSQMMM